MQREVFARLADECARYPTTLWLHFLGEPLMHGDLPWMIAHAKTAGVRTVGLSTNAVLLRGTLADALLESGLDRLECSMDAVDRDGYRVMRGRDHFARATRNVRAFLARKVRSGKETPLTSIQFMRTTEVEAALPDIIATWRPHLGARDFIMTIAPASFGGAIAVPAPPADDVASGRPPCNWLFESLVVLQDGTVTMCGADWDAHAPLGNVSNQSIAAIWNGAEMQRRRSAHEEGRFATVRPCADCDDWRLADGRGYRNVLVQESRVGSRESVAGPGRR
jgi:radical SAM protein with 4Fe4S-binding SPASM domain